MAEAFAIAVAGRIAGQLSTPAIQGVGRIWGVNDELEHLRYTVSTIQAVLLDAEEQRRRAPMSHQVRDWIKRLKDVLYDAEDLLEYFSVEARLRDLRSRNKIMKQVRTFFSSSNQLVYKVKMASRLNRVRMKLDAIRNDRDFHLEERRVESREEIRHEETHSHIPEGMLIGRDSDRRQIIEMLLGSETEENISVVSIVGMGGIGKTALAQSVYDEEIVQKHFELRIWVCVSDTFYSSDKLLIRKVISRAKRNAIQECFNLDDLQESFRKEINHKRFLFVLDDLWNEDRENWLKFKNMLGGGAPGSKILITTRSYEVALVSGSSQNSYNLQSLSEMASLDLFMQVASEEGQEITTLEKALIGKEIIRKCGGVPLSIRAIGGMLFARKTKAEWLNLKNNEIRSLSQGILGILRLSYDHLPSNLKHCFVLCSLFPKEGVIDAQTLMDLWIANRLIPSPSNDGRNLKVTAQDYIRHLVSRNFIQAKEVDDHGNVVSYTMHNLLHDLAFDIVRLEYGEVSDGSTHHFGMLRHLSYQSNSSLSHYYKYFAHNVAKVRTLFYTPNTNRNIGTLSVHTCHKLLSNSRCLRFLTLHNTNMRIVPSSLCKLRLLCYLDLSYNEKLKGLPKSMKSLQNLITIKLIDCHKLKKLSQDIGKLVSLQHIDLGHNCSLNHMPHGLGKLTSLCTLTHFIPGGSMSNFKNHAKLNELKDLNNLRGNLEIIINGHVSNATVESEEADMKAKYLLEGLMLRWGNVEENKHNEEDVIQNHEILLKGLQPHSNLRSLHVSNFKGASFPRWLMGDNAECLANLIELNLVGCERCLDLSQLSLLPKLRILTIIGLSAIESIGDPYPETETSSSDLTSALSPYPSLIELKIHDCPKLKAMPQIQNLESLDVRNICEELLNQSIPLYRLKSLWIERIEHLESLRTDFLQNLISLARLQICECPRLTSLSLGLEHVKSLSHLSISKCKLLDLCIDENSHEMLQFQGLVNLHYLNLFSLPKLTSLPEWIFHITTLEELQIWDCSNLTTLSDRVGNLVSLQRLEIHNCPNLASLPESMRTLGSLQYLEIEGCELLEGKCKREEDQDYNKIAHVPELKKEMQSRYCTEKNWRLSKRMSGLKRWRKSRNVGDLILE